MSHPSIFLLSLGLVVAAATPAGASLIPKPDGLLGKKSAPALISPAAAPARVAREAGMSSRWDLWARPGLWVVPSTAGTGDLGFSRPAWTLRAGAWRGPWGLEGGVTAFSEVRAAFRQAPYFQANTFMTDLLVSRRLQPGPTRIFGGYRGLGRGDLNFLTVGGAMDRPLRQPGFRLIARGQVGADFAGSMFADGQIGLGYRFGAFGVEGGLRHFSLSAAGDPWFHLTGPALSLSGRF